MSTRHEYEISLGGMSMAVFMNPTRATVSVSDPLKMAPTEVIADN
jgi:hypothetical protein